MYSLAFLLLFQFSHACNEALEPQSTPLVTENLLPTDSAWQDPSKPEPIQSLLKSVDGGQTWTDIREGLPEVLKDVSCFADENGFYLRVGNEVYRNAPDASHPDWNKEMLPDNYPNIAPGKSGIFAFNYNGQFVQRSIGMPVWSPVYTGFKEHGVHTIYETAAGTVIVGTDNGIMISLDRGTTWKEAYTGGWAREIAESNGVLLATSQGGILRSTNEGQHWDYVVREGGVGIDVACIRGGFAVINFNTESQIRRIRASYDGGLTWKAIDNGIPPTLSISSIVEVDGNFLCGHPKGIYQSTDKGKSWKMIVPTVENKVYNLLVSGKVIYAVPMDGGC